MLGKIMRKINNYLYYKPITFDNLLKCFYEVRKTCKNKKDVYTRIGFAPLGNTDFLNTVTRMIASSLRVHGDDISANYSYELTDLITSEVNTLMHKPEIAQKLQILKAKYDTLK